MPQKFINAGRYELLSSVSDSDTTLNLLSSVGLPVANVDAGALTSGDWFRMVLQDTDGIEVITVRTRPEGSDQLSNVVRGQEGTPARAWNAGTVIGIRWTAADAAAALAPETVASVQGLQSALDAKINQETGKGLSTQDYTTAEKNKLAAVATGATANATDAALRSRSTHTGTQEIATVAGLQAALDAKLPLTGGGMAGQLVGQRRSLTMSGAAVDGGDGNGSFVARSSATQGDGNLAGMTFWHDAYAIRLGVRGDGYFGLGSYSRAAWSWYSDVSGNMVAAGNIQAYSDPDLKDNVVPIANALELISKLDGVQFVWNHKTNLIGKPGQADIGVLADQVEAVMPEAVGRSIPDEENGGHQWRTVDYSKLVPLLIQGVKELAAELQALKGSNR
ncbi:tail fiber domain-containing protein [Comamonas sp.]|uniref:tail fiber domain-containing protein n=1 Tax=Comamonas sp. TaxID=34028 RepID=UPI00289DE3A9|nr:tail fiber domain-containing protein [Comamonas sp.]